MNWWMNIQDKIDLPNEEARHCLPHYLPHRLPILTEQPVTDEACHIHMNDLRHLHHRVYCRLVACPYYETMLQFRKKQKKLLKCHS